jgi:hypothetical protein
LLTQKEEILVKRERCREKGKERETKAEDSISFFLF